MIEGIKKTIGVVVIVMLVPWPDVPAVVRHASN